MQTVANRVAIAMEKTLAQRRHPNPETCLQSHLGENEALALLIYIVVTEDKCEISSIANVKINLYQTSYNNQNLLLAFYDMISIYFTKNILAL